MTRLLIALLSLGLLAACAERGPDGAPNLLVLTDDDTGPDEFAILPGKPLEAPESYAELPTPTPGGRNRTDLTPVADAAIALGGRPGASAPGVPARNAGLLAYVTRNGVSPDIRAVTAAEDLEVRRQGNGRILERLFNQNLYYRAYSRQSLDKYAELERWRAAGVRTPSAPPGAANDPRGRVFAPDAFENPECARLGRADSLCDPQRR